VLLLLLSGEGVETGAGWLAVVRDEGLREKRAGMGVW